MSIPRRALLLNLKLKLDLDLGLFAALPDAVKRQIHHHLAKGDTSSAAPLGTSMFSGVNS